MLESRVSGVLPRKAGAVVAVMALLSGMFAFFAPGAYAAQNTLITLTASDLVTSDANGNTQPGAMTTNQYARLDFAWDASIAP